jgi:hypothetical protein
LTITANEKMEIERGAKRLKEKVTIATGGAQGIVKASVLRSAKEGARMAVLFCLI